MNFSSLKVGTRLALGSGALVALMLAITAGGIVKLRSINHEIEVLVSDRAPKLQKANDWIVSMLLSAKHSRNLLLLDDKGTVAAELAALRSDIATRAAITSDLEPTIRTAEGKAVFAAAIAHQPAYAAALDKFMALIEAGRIADAKVELYTDLVPILLSYQAAIDAFIAFETKQGVAQGIAAQAAYSDGIALMLWFAAAGLALAAAVSVVQSRAILGQLGGEPAYATAIARRIAQGDLSGSVAVRPGDTRSLLFAMQEMTHSLAKVVGEVREAVASVTTASGEIAAGNLDLSGRTEQQAGALEQTAAAVDELASTSKNSADNARQADQLATAASTAAVKGGAIVAQVVATMDGINASGKKISEIIAVIDGIAFQTNILALNAAVEAARAGEQGRGFAVVATEVRSLAQRSAQAAREIKDLIGASVQRVEAGSAQVAQAGVAMNDIVVQVARVTDLIGEISHATQEQSSGVSQVNEAVSNIDKTTQQNAALVEQSSAAAQSLNDQARRLTQAVEVFRL